MSEIFYKQMPSIQFESTSKMTVWAGGEPMPGELKHAARILTVKEWIKKNKNSKYVVYGAFTPMPLQTVNRPYK